MWVSFNINFYYASFGNVIKLVFGNVIKSLASFLVYNLCHELCKSLY